MIGSCVEAKIVGRAVVNEARLKLVFGVVLFTTICMMVRVLGP
jgi:hypothetical protein